MVIIGILCGIVIENMRKRSVFINQKISYKINLLTNTIIHNSKKNVTTAHKQDKQMLFIISSEIRTVTAKKKKHWEITNK